MKPFSREQEIKDAHIFAKAVKDSDENADLEGERQA